MAAEKDDSRIVPVHFCRVTVISSHVPGPFSRRRPQGSPYKKARTQVLTPYGRPCEPFTVVFPTPKPVPRPNGQGQGSSFRQILHHHKNCRISTTGNGLL